jgi:pre-mRNA-splicing factor SYF1
MYAQYEENYGLAKNAMEIYDRATRSVAKGEQIEVFKVFLAKSTTMFGLTYTRPIFEKALQTLPDDHARYFSFKFVEMELSLGEVDRARSILAYSSQFSNPHTETDFWNFWKDFEVKHGNEETFKEMLR